MAQQTDDSLVAVVVTHNRLEHLKVTVSRLLDAPPDILHALVVVDNASDHDTANWLAEQNDPRLVNLRSDTNDGGAGGFARGMAYAVESFDPDWLVVMDDDGRPEPGALAEFHGLGKSGWDAMAAAVYFPSGEICEMNRPSRNPFWHTRAFWRSAFRGRAGFHLTSKDYARQEPFGIDVTSFVGFFISRAGIQKAGYPDPDLFIYGDDGIYTLGLTAAGGRIAFAPSVHFEHDLSTFSGQRGRFRPLWKAYYYHRNLLIMYRKAAGPWFWLVLLAILPRWFFKARDHAGQRKAFVRLVIRAVHDGLSERKTATLDEVKAWADD